MKPATINNFTGDLEEASCPICPEPPDPTLIFRAISGTGFWMYPICNVQFASPRFTNDSLLKIYENESFADLSFYNDWTYEKWRKENRHGSYITQKLKLHALSRYLNENDRILDVGCGPGLFCLEASRHGLKAEDIEPSGMLADIGRKKLNIEIHQGLLEDFEPAYKFDGITVWDVLEHVPNPVEILTKSYEIISKIIISVSKKYNLSDYITCLAQKN